MFALLGLIPLVTSLLGAASPIIGGLTHVLSGPAQGSVLLKIADSAQKIFGTTSPDQIALQIQQDKSKADQFKAEVEAHVTEYQAWIADVASARSMEVAALQSGSVVQWIPVILTVVIFGLFGLAFWVVGGDKISNNPNASLMVGAIMTAFGSVVGYWFGSSRGSAEKSVTIREAVVAAVKNGVGRK